MEYFQKYINSKEINICHNHHGDESQSFHAGKYLRPSVISYEKEAEVPSLVHLPPLLQIPSICPVLTAIATPGPETYSAGSRTLERAPTWSPSCYVYPSFLFPQSEEETVACSVRELPPWGQRGLPLTYKLGLKSL